MHRVLVPSHADGIRAAFASEPGVQGARKGAGRLGDERFLRSLERITGRVLRRRRPGSKHRMEER